MEISLWGCTEADGCLPQCPYGAAQRQMGAYLTGETQLWLA